MWYHLRKENPSSMMINIYLKGNTYEREVITITYGTWNASNFFS